MKIAKTNMKKLNIQYVIMQCEGYDGYARMQFYWYFMFMKSAFLSTYICAAFSALKIIASEALHVALCKLSCCSIYFGLSGVRAAQIPQSFSANFF